MGDVSVVTGGAGGIGLATAKIIGREHAVVICDVQQDRLEAAQSDLSALGIECLTALCDITDRHSITELVAVAARLGTLRSVLHTAGLSPNMGSAERITRVNVIGTINVNEAFRQNAGEGFAAVNVASMASYMLPRPMWPTKLFACAERDEDDFIAKTARIYRAVPSNFRPGMAYSLSKTFVRWYCAAQAARFGDRGARIVSVSPGSIETEMGRLEESSGAGAMAQHAALKRFGKPEEIAALLAFCASESAGYLTGVDILCDGGVMAGLSLVDKLTMARNAK